MRTILPGRARTTYIGDALEEDWLAGRIGAVGKCANSLGALALKSAEHPIQALQAHSIQKPLDIGSGKATHSIEDQGSILRDDWPLDDEGGLLAFCHGHLLQCSLHL